MAVPGKYEGMGRFTLEVLRHLTASHPEAHFSLFFDAPPDPSIAGKNISTYVLRPPMRHPFLYYAWLEFSLVRALRAIEPDIFFSPDGFLSLRSPVPQIPVIHDLGFEHMPEHVKWQDRKYYLRYFPKFARAASHILTVSEYSRMDIASRYRVDPSDVTVVYNGGSASFRPTGEEAQRKVRERYTGGAPYFLYVGALQPRKNIGNLLRAFDRFKDESGSDINLVVVGRLAWKNDRMLGIYQSMKYRDEVVFTGFVDDDELNTIYGAALALTYVPTFEGFGIPVLEAFHAETAVITSNVTSLPEVAGEAALLVSPERPEEIAAAMSRMAGDPGLRASLVERGRIQRAKFGWELTGARTWEAIVNTVERAGRSPNTTR